MLSYGGCGLGCVFTMVRCNMNSGRGQAARNLDNRIGAALHGSRAMNFIRRVPLLRRCGRRENLGD
jgi:hypothetical protein